MDLAGTLTIVGMVVVFAALIILALAISLLGKAININKNAIAEKAASNAIKTDIVNTGAANTQSQISNQDDKELIAVITAAIMASMKGSSDFKIRVKSFRRIPDNSPEWNIAGKLTTINANIIR
ncbi:MAG TPA: OadG family protein [Clostridiaceae bacterium]|nr:OadG family protein [Clostridiaceae bacterium]